MKFTPLQVAKKTVSTYWHCADDRQPSSGTPKKAATSQGSENFNLFPFNFKLQKRARHHRRLRRRHLQARKRTSDAACPGVLGAQRARCCLFLKRLQVFRREAVTGLSKRQMARRGNGCYMAVGWMMGFKATSIPYYAKSIFPRSSANFSPVALPKDRCRVRFHKIASCSTGRGRQSQKPF